MPPANLVEPELRSLPPFILSSEDGVFVHMAALAGNDDFPWFVEKLYSAGFFLRGLRYKLFQNLVHEWTPSPNGGRELLADSIAAFEPARRGVYKGVRISPGGEKAEYMFEPAFIETIERIPEYGPINDDGTCEVLSWSERRDMKPTELDPDEFVFDLWGKGVRYGIDIKRLHRIIARKETGRIEIARMLQPIEGTDAEILEVFKALHRDNSPKLLAGSRHDLRQYTNRFPQIDKNVEIFKKIPRIPGIPGFTVTGKVVEPVSKPKDFDLHTMAGPGTRVEQRHDGEYIVSIKDGFLSLDSRTNQVSVDEKVINKEGVSLRTTGDLSLTGDAFESHGDVQERRIVEGKNMSFHGDVYGEIISRGGEIKINGNIVSGRAISPGGSIFVMGRASQAELRAVDGVIDLISAEGCKIVATKVRIEQALGCEIMAEVIEAKMLQGCKVAAKTIHIKTSLNRRDAETVVNVLIPDFSAFRACEVKINADLDQIRSRSNLLSSQIDQLRSQPELSNFITLDRKLKQGEIKLNAEQSELAHKASQRFRPILQKIDELSVALDKLNARSEQMQSELQVIKRQSKEMVASITCRIDAITGETVVRTLPLMPHEPILSDTQIAAIHPRLRHQSSHQRRLYAGADGEFEWHYEEPDADMN